MAVTEIMGKKIIQIKYDESGGDWEMTRDWIIRAIRITGLSPTDYVTIYEAAGDRPVIVRLDYDRPATFFQGTLFTRIGIDWDQSNIASPANAIISIEVE